LTRIIPILNINKTRVATSIDHLIQEFGRPALATIYVLINLAFSPIRVELKKITLLKTEIVCAMIKSKAPWSCVTPTFYKNKILST
jgi:hypothetical protein